MAPKRQKILLVGKIFYLMSCQFNEGKNVMSSDNFFIFKK